MRKKLLTLIVLSACAAGAYAAAPDLLTYQGRLKEGGLAVTGNRTVDILLCPGPSGAGCLSDGPQPVAVSNGLFRSTFTVPAGVDLGGGSWYLEIKVGADTLTPRERLTSSAYAVYATTAALAVTVPDASVTRGKLAQDGCADGQILKLSGGAWVCGTDATAVASIGNSYYVQMVDVTGTGFVNSQLQQNAVGTGITLLGGSSFTVTGAAFSAGGTAFTVNSGSVSLTGVIRSSGTGDNYFAGRLGVGKAAPAYALDVSGSINADSSICIAGNCKSSWASAGDNLGDHTATQNLNMGGYDIASAGQLAVSSVTGPGTAYIYVNQNLALPASSLAVGRGSSLSSFPMAVYANDPAVAQVLQLDNKTAAAGAGVRLLFSGNDSGLGTIDMVDENAAGLTSMRFSTFNGELLRLYGTRAGIGSTEPDQKLTVAGNISQTGVLISSGTGDNYFAGRVGIGTDSPVVALQVQGDIRIPYAGKFSIAGNDALWWDSGSGSIALGNAGAPLRFYAGSATPRMYITAAGNAGIGAAAPTARFEVSGGSAVVHGQASDYAAFQAGDDGIIVSTGGALQTTGIGHGATAGNPRGMAAVDLQTSRTQATEVASGNYSSIGGGRNNSATGLNAAIGGGYGNTAGGDNSFIGSGQGNATGNTMSVVAGGQGNQATANASFVGGGYNNTASFDYAVVGGGDSNIASGQHSVVAGGKKNRALGLYSFVGGGAPTSGVTGNIAESDYSAIVGGSSNTADSNSWMSFIGGGAENTASAQQVFVGGGWMNTAGKGSNYYSAVVAGYSNRSIGDSSFVGAGGNNVASGANSVVPGGAYNTAKGSYSLAGGNKSSSTANGTFTWSDSIGAVMENAVADRTVFKNRGGFLVSGSTNTNMLGTVDRAVFVTGDGLMGVSTGAPQAALDVVSSGTLVTQYAQIWRSGDGAAVASMTATGLLYMSSAAVRGALTASIGVPVLLGNEDFSGSALVQAAGAGIWSSDSSAGDTVLRAESGKKLIMQSGNGSSNLVVGSDGKVGIGVSAPTAPLDVNGSSIRIRTAGTVANSNDVCLAGEIRWDASYIYVCVAANTWMRATLGTW